MDRGIRPCHRCQLVIINAPPLYASLVQHRQQRALLRDSLSLQTGKTLTVRNANTNVEAGLALQQLIQQQQANLAPHLGLQQQQALAAATAAANAVAAKATTTASLAGGGGGPGLMQFFFMATQ